MSHDMNYDEYSPEMQKKILDFIKQGLPSVPAEGTQKPRVGNFREPDWTKDLALMAGMTTNLDEMMLDFKRNFTEGLITHVLRNGKRYPVKVVDVKIVEPADQCGFVNRIINLSVEYEVLKGELYVEESAEIKPEAFDALKKRSK